MDNEITNVSYSQADFPSMIDCDSEKKLLGYDWIAALLDNDNTDEKVIEESEDFFENLKNFRRINRNECSSHVCMETALSQAESTQPCPVGKEISEKRVKPFQVNERLFTVPIKNCLADFHGSGDDQARRKIEEPKPNEARFVRVSIPRHTVESAYQFKAHRRRSFDPTDSCGLREHCLMGWENSQPASIPAATTIGLSDATEGVPYKMTTTLADAEHVARAHEWSFPSDTTSSATQCMPEIPPWRRRYQDALINMSSIGVPRPVAPDTDMLRKATADLLNSTYSMMYEMDRLKHE